MILHLSTKNAPSQRPNIPSVFTCNYYRCNIGTSVYQYTRCIYLRKAHPKCTAYIVRHTLYGIHCTAYIVRHTLYGIHCTAYIVRHTLYGIHCTAYIVRHTLYGIHCTAYIVRSTLKQYH